jgi:two-component system, NarL family, nitrate/nitrite response regulator NarL
LEDVGKKGCRISTPQQTNIAIGRFVANANRSPSSGFGAGLRQMDNVNFDASGGRGWAHRAPEELEPMAPSKVMLMSPMRLEREALRLVLEEAGFAVSACVDGVVELEAMADTDGVADLLLVGVPWSAEPRAWEPQLKQLRAMLPGTRIVLLADHDPAEWLSVCWTANIDGYLSKNASLAVFQRQLNLAIAGERVYPFDLVRQLIAGNVPQEQPPGASEALASISQKEIEILRYLIDGFPNKTIAERLKIAESTVKVRVKILLRKISAVNRTQAAIWALNHGLHRIEDGAAPAREEGVARENGLAEGRD